ncbi:hypothetical protein E2C01_006359 [Portunus trituberculatus]|uniref:SEA domain-containing protein n=1 Tax=Portunus trituberculatus TaxID=210409 RepID=A0A5B7CW45_PORTR|nr:hypothetical protein [Portunus trituberculatus]
MVSLQVSLKVDRVGPQRIVWTSNYANPAADEYRLLQWEAQHAISKAISKTRLGTAYLSNAVNSFYSLGGKVIVNATVNLEDQPATRTRAVLQALQRQMIQVIQSHANNIGDSPLGVDGTLNPIPDVSEQRLLTLCTPRQQGHNPLGYIKEYTERKLWCGLKFGGPMVLPSVRSEYFHRKRFQE